MSWRKSGTELGQFLIVFLPTLGKYVGDGLGLSGHKSTTRSIFSYNRAYLAFGTKAKFKRLRDEKGRTARHYDHELSK